jgi:hypothetical protein
LRGRLRLRFANGGSLGCGHRKNSQSAEGDGQSHAGFNEPHARPRMSYAA